MSIAKDLQIHSDHQDDGFDFAAEEDRPKRLEFIGRDNPKRFYIAVSISLLVLAFVFFSAVCISIFPMVGKKEKKQKKSREYVGKLWEKILGGNNRKLNNGYFLFTICLVFLSLVLVAAIPALGRQRRKYLFIPPIFLGLWYLSWFIMGYETYNFEFGAGYVLQTIWGYLIFFNAAFGTLLASLTANRKPRLQVALSVSLVWVVAEIVFMWVFSQNSSPRAWSVMINVIAQCLVTAYLTLDLEFMFTHRFDFYLVGDWFLGLVHLLTDWTFRFWHNLFIKRKRVPPSKVGINRVLNTSVNTNEEEGPEVVEATTPNPKFEENSAAADNE